MAKQVQLRSGTTIEHSTYTGVVAEVTVDTTKNVVVVHDGVTAGGSPMAAKANTDGTISLIKKDGTSAGVINTEGLFNDTLTSTNTNQALTAAQGKVLQDGKLDKTAISASGSAPYYVARAWVYFDASSGTPSILGSGNVSSIADDGVGAYTVNFSTAMQNTNFAAIATAKRDANLFVHERGTRTTSSVSYTNKQDDASSGDCAMSVVVFR